MLAELACWIKNSPVVQQQFREHSNVIDRSLCFPECKGVSIDIDKSIWFLLKNRFFQMTDCFISVNVAFAGCPKTRHISVRVDILSKYIHIRYEQEDPLRSEDMTNKCRDVSLLQLWTREVGSSDSKNINSVVVRPKLK